LKVLKIHVAPLLQYMTLLASELAFHDAFPISFLVLLVDGRALTRSAT
jgi:hypothetical protein